MPSSDSGSALMLIGMFGEVQEPMWKLIGVLVCSFFSDLLPRFHSLYSKLYSGPDALSFVQAHQYQQNWLKEFPRSRSVNEAMSRSTLDTSPDFHIRLLDQLLVVIPYVLPPDEISFPYCGILIYMLTISWSNLKTSRMWSAF